MRKESLALVAGPVSIHQPTLITGPLLSYGHRQPLAYSAGSYAAFLRRMIERAPWQTVLGPGGKRLRPLQSINLATEHDLTLAFFKAWASVGAVLAFYSERYANEGYLFTAVERLSVLELAYEVGYQPAPGMAADTYLAFMLRKAASVPKRIVVPKGTTVQSIPAQGEQAVTFETEEAIEARTIWNAITPYMSSTVQPARIYKGDTLVRAIGLDSRIRAGCALLMMDSATPKPDVPAYLRLIETVVPQPTINATFLTWSDPLGVTKGDGGLPASTRPASPKATSTPLLDQPHVYGFAQQARLYGSHAPDWHALPPVKKARYAARLGGVFQTADGGETWAASIEGLPFSNVQAVLGTEAGALFAATEEGLFQRAAGQTTWVRSTVTPPQQNFRALALGPYGALYASTATNSIYRSMDGGETWRRIARTSALVESNELVVPRPHGLWPRLVRGKTSPQQPLSSAIRVLTVLPATKRHAAELLAGATQGVVRIPDSGGQWASSNRGLSTDTGTVPTVNAFFTDPHKGYLFAATSHGVYCSENRGHRWRNVSGHGRERLDTYGRTVYTITGTANQGHHRLFAGTNEGLFRSDDGGKQWVPVPLVEGSEQPVAVYAVVASTAVPATFVLAGTSLGLFRSADKGQTWTQAAPAPIALFSIPQTYQTELAEGPVPLIIQHIFQNHGITLSTDAHVTAEGKTAWRIQTGKLQFQITQEANRLKVTLMNRLPDGPIRTLAAIPQGPLLVGTPFEGFVQADWPIFHVEPNRLLLNKHYTGLTKDSLVVLYQEDKKPLMAVVRVKSVFQVKPTGPSTAGSITELYVTTNDDLVRFDVQQTTVFIQSSAISLFERIHTEKQPLTGSQIQLDGRIQGLSKGQNISITGRRASIRLLGPFGGVFRVDAKAYTLAGLEGYSVLALAGLASNTLYAGTNEGIFQLQKGVSTSLGLADQTVSHLVQTASGELFAGTAKGVFKYAEKAWHVVLKEAPTALIADPNGQVYAGTESALYRIEKGKASVLVKDLPVEALAVQDSLYVATSKGLVRWDNGTETTLGLADRVIRDIAVHDAEHIYAATSGGVFCGDGHHWVRCHASPDVQVLQVDTQGTVYAGTRGHGLLVSSDQGKTWQLRALGASNDVRALCIDEQDAIAVGTQRATVLTTPAGRPQDAFVPNIIVRLPLVFRTPLDHGYLSKALRALFEQQNAVLSVKAIGTVIMRGKAWVIRNTDGKPDYVLHASAAEIVVYQSTLLQVYEPTQILNTEVQRWQVGLPTGKRGQLTVAATAVIPEDAPATNEQIGEVVQVAEAVVTLEKPYTAVTFARPLQQVFSRTTALLNGNLVFATHGTSIRHPLGKPSREQRYPTFTLPSNPLTYTHVDGRLKNSLQIYVQTTPDQTTLIGQSHGAEPVKGTLWKEVQALSDNTALDTVYTVRHTAKQKTLIQFGNGVHGHRLPADTQNIMAAYRSGSGTVGNIAANRLKILRQGPSAVKSVTNPIPATGGTAPESNLDARTIAPLRLRPLGRIVSLQDYEDVALTFTAVEEAQVSLIETEQGPTVFVTLVTDLKAGPNIADALTKQVEQIRVSPYPFACHVFTPLYFHVHAGIVVGHGATATEVLDAIKKRLATTFVMMHQRLGQTVSASEVIALMQDVGGVEGVQLKAFYAEGFRPLKEDVLRAKPARWDHHLKRIQPAQMLLLKPTSGVVLDLEKT